jgi:heptosyltransferase-2
MTTLRNIKTWVRDALRSLPLGAWSALSLFIRHRTIRVVDQAIELPALVFLTNAIGDTVLALPALDTISQSLSSEGVEVLTRPKTAPLLKDYPGIRKVITIEKLNFPFRAGTLLENVRTLRGLRRQRYRSALILTSNFWTAWMAFFIGAKRRYGFSRLEQVGLFRTSDFGFLLTHDKGEAKTMNYMDAHLEFVEWLGLSVGNQTNYPKLEVADSHNGSRLIEKLSASAGGKPIVVMNPFASQRVKEWPLNHWMELAESLDRSSVLVVMCCENDRGIELRAKLKPDSDVVLLTGLTLVDFMSLLALADVVVTNDSGPLHLSHALGKPTVAIFGPTHPGEVLPKGIPVTVIRNGIECSPCYHLGSYDVCPLSHHRCLQEIRPGEVLATVLASLRGPARDVGPNVDLIRQGAGTTTVAIR